MRKKYHRALCLAFFLIAFSVFAIRPVRAQKPDVVLMKGIRYSVFPFFAGDKIRVYTAMQNNSGYDIRGTMSFYDNNTLITDSPFSAVNGSIVEVWGDVSATAGAHVLATRMTSVKKYEVGKNQEPIEIANNSLETHFTVESDTDGDRIGNSADTDDDNDGMPDEEEIAQNTNPLVANKPTIPKEPENINRDKPRLVPMLPQKEDESITKKFIAPLEDALNTNALPIVNTGAQAIQKLVKANNNLTRGIADALKAEKNTITNEREQAKTMSALSSQNTGGRHFIQTAYLWALTASLFLLKIWPLVLLALAYCIIAWKLRKRKW